ncbi:response regulator [Paenibacillus septentrionalis]|uniref:Response regulator n=1 Tax=Paenibacillus septentrionalis TaxID=429342 RepID=A0ABW1V703_9BACL
MIKLLIADDEPRTREGIKRSLEGWLTEDYQLFLAENGLQALELLEQHDIDVLISDIRMPGLSGLELVERLDRINLKPICIFISGYSEFTYAQKAIQYEAVDYLLKPIEKKTIVEAVQRALLRRDERLEKQRMKKMVDVELVELEQETSHEEVNKAIQYVRAHLAEAISVKQLADMLHMNASYFSQLFKEQTGISFSEYLARQRLQLAKRLLLTTNLSIQDIAERVGYQTDRYFIRVFRAHEQISPAQFRKQKS